MLDSLANAKVSRRRFLSSSVAGMGTLAGAGVLLDACNTTSTTSSPGKTTLNVMYNTAELTPAYIKQFEQIHPNIKINFIAFDQARLNAMFAAGTSPDFIRASAVGSANNAARGLALNLDPYLAKSSVLKASDLLGINDSWRWDGKKVGQGSYYGITKDWSQDQTIWYNQDLLEKAGFAALSPTEPITYDQLFTMATKLTTRQGGKTLVYGYGTQWAWGLIIIVMMMVTQQGGSLYNADGTQVDFTTPEAQKAIDWFITYEQAKIGPSSLDLAAAGWDGPNILANQMSTMMGGGMVIMLAGLQGVPGELLEAAQIDGASRWQGFWYITFPQLTPVIFFEVTTGVIASIQTLVQPLLLAESDQLTAAANVPQSNYLYMVNVCQQFFGNLRFGYGAAMLWVLFVVILCITMLVFRSSSFWVYYNVERD